MAQYMVRQQLLFVMAAMQLYPTPRAAHPPTPLPPSQSPAGAYWGRRPSPNRRKRTNHEISPRDERSFLQASCVDKHRKHQQEQCVRHDAAGQAVLVSTHYTQQQRQGAPWEVRSTLLAQTAKGNTATQPLTHLLPPSPTPAVPPPVPQRSPTCSIA